MKLSKRSATIYMLCISLLFYALCSLINFLPLENQTIPYAIDNPQPEKRYSYYTITDESGSHELMKIPIIVHIGDEVLAADNKLYQIIRIEDSHAYAKFIRQIKL